MLLCDYQNSPVNSMMNVIEGGCFVWILNSFRWCHQRLTTYQREKGKGLLKREARLTKRLSSHDSTLQPTILKELIQFKHVFNASQKYWGALVDLGRLHIQYPAPSCRTSPPCLFDYHRHWSAFVQQSKLAIWIVSCRRVSVNATIDQDVVDIRHQCPNITGCSPVKYLEGPVSYLLSH
jgi:hypothetical protein